MVVSFMKLCLFIISIITLMLMFEKGNRAAESKVLLRSTNFNLVFSFIMFTIYFKF